MSFISSNGPIRSTDSARAHGSSAVCLQLPAVHCFLVHHLRRDAPVSLHLVCGAGLGRRANRAGAGRVAHRFTPPPARHAGRRSLLIGVYVVTALISISFSYTSLYTWFSARERPAMIERRLYDTLNVRRRDAETFDRSHRRAAEARARAPGDDGRREDARSHFARAGCRCIPGTCGRPWRGKRRPTRRNYKEGSGEGVRYSAFDRYTKLAEQSLASECSGRRQIWPLSFRRPSRWIRPRSNLRHIGRSTTTCLGTMWSRRCIRASREAAGSGV